MKLHELTEDAWDDAESRRSTPNPLTVGDDDVTSPVFDMGDDLVNKLIAKYRAIKKYANMQYPELAVMARKHLGTMEDVPISQTISIEPYLDGEHLRALVHNKPTTDPSGAITLIKLQDKYYIQDGNHRVVAAAFRGEKTINGLVIDVTEYANTQELDESTYNHN